MIVKPYSEVLSSTLITISIVKHSFMLLISTQTINLILELHKTVYYFSLKITWDFPAL